MQISLAEVQSKCAAEYGTIFLSLKKQQKKTVATGAPIVWDCSGWEGKGLTFSSPLLAATKPTHCMLSMLLLPLIVPLSQVAVLLPGQIAAWEFSLAM